MTKPSLTVYLVFAHREGYLVAIDLHDPQTPLGLNKVISANNGEQGIFEEVARASPDEAMIYALPLINFARERCDRLLMPAYIQPPSAAERPAADGDKVVAFRTKAAAEAKIG